jgi:hypothetical protein
MVIPVKARPILYILEIVGGIRIKPLPVCSSMILRFISRLLFAIFICCHSLTKNSDSLFERYAILAC